MRKIVSLSVLSAVLLASLVGCTTVPNAKSEDVLPLDSKTVQIKTLYGDSDSQKIRHIGLLCVDGYAFLRTDQGGGYSQNSSIARFTEKDIDCEHTKLSETEESGKE